MGSRADDGEVRVGNSGAHEGFPYEMFAVIGVSNLPGVSVCL
jgi:hypothetical protein